VNPYGANIAARASRSCHGNGGGRAGAPSAPPHGLGRHARHLPDGAPRDPGAQHDAPVRGGHPGELRRGRGRIGREDDAEHRQHEVGARVGKRQRRGLAGREGHLEAARHRVGAGHVQEPGGGIDAGDDGAPRRGLERRIPGARADVDDALTRGGGGALDDGFGRGQQLGGSALVAADVPVERRRGGGGPRGRHLVNIEHLRHRLQLRAGLERHAGGRRF
jgi:hypothetical protein